MRKALTALLTLASLAGAAPASATCNVSCLSRKVASLSAKITRLEAFVSQQSNAGVNAGTKPWTAESSSTWLCLNEVPVAARQDSDGRYALTLTSPGENVSAWVITDMCNPSRTATRAPLDSLSWGTR